MTATNDASAAGAASAAGVAARVAALESLFRQVAATRMAGVPVMHPGLAVRAVGFEADAAGEGAVGILVTPWFMNLVWLPLVPQAEPLRVGVLRARAVGCERFTFIGADEPGFGPYEASSLFSPMFDFVDQAAALATAQAVLQALREPPQRPHADQAPLQASRRALLFGRGAEGAR